MSAYLRTRHSLTERELLEVRRAIRSAVWQHRLLQCATALACVATLALLAWQVWPRETRHVIELVLLSLSPS